MKSATDLVNLIGSIAWVGAGLAWVAYAIHAILRFRKEMLDLERSRNKLERLQREMEDGIGKQSDSGRKPWS